MNEKQIVWVNVCFGVVNVLVRNILMNQINKKELLVSQHGSILLPAMTCTFLVITMHFQKYQKIKVFPIHSIFLHQKFHNLFRMVVGLTTTEFSFHRVKWKEQHPVETMVVISCFIRVQFVLKEVDGGVSELWDVN